ncbi:protein kinase, ATP binding site-containing protein [Tanacetum coccineum]
MSSVGCLEQFCPPTTPKNDPRTPQRGMQNSVDSDDMMVLQKFFPEPQNSYIKLATNNFADANCIGRGGFGEVYKGELVHSKGHTIVALKRLNRAFGQGDPAFWKEIIMLSLYKHDNIVSLLGFCDESSEKILVYEYASKRSLDLYLDSDDLTWTQLLKICIGAARGFAYLHSSVGTHQRVLHPDIKSSNILLDENWNARISDMGLSKFGPANQQITFLVSHAVRTLGYCDPQYIETGLLTKDSDVYSFANTLFETKGVNYEGYKQNVRGELAELAQRKPVSGFVQSRRGRIELMTTLIMALLRSRLIRAEPRANTSFETEGVKYEGFKDFLEQKKQNGLEELAALARYKPVSDFVQSRREHIEDLLRSRLIKAEPRGVDEEESTTDEKIRLSVTRAKHSICLPN